MTFIEKKGWPFQSVDVHFIIVLSENPPYASFQSAV